MEHNIINVRRASGIREKVCVTCDDRVESGTKEEAEFLKKHV